MKIKRAKIKWYINMLMGFGSLVDGLISILSFGLIFSDLAFCISLRGVPQGSNNDMDTDVKSFHEKMVDAFSKFAPRKYFGKYD